MLVNLSFCYLPLMSFATLSGRNYYPLSSHCWEDSRNTFCAPPSTKEWTSQEQRGAKLLVLERTFFAGSPHPTPLPKHRGGRLLPANPDLFSCKRPIENILAQREFTTA